MSAHLQRGTIAFVVVLVAGALYSSEAKAVAQHRLEHCKGRPARTELACGRRALHLHTTAARWIRNHESRTVEATTWSASSYWRSRLKFHRWRMRVDRRTIAGARHRLSRLAPVAWTGGIAHEALWLCIHRGEGAWNANTGNGFYGGLQMTSGWGGVARPDLLSPTAQMALAERQYRASGYSTAWLGQQWPNTSPPCLGHA